MSTYVPELGQALFGQPHGTHACPAILEAALGMIREQLEYLVHAALPYEKRERWHSPFSNYSNAFSCPVFQVEAYSWNEDVPQEWNFRCGDIRVSWYKGFGRGVSCHGAYTPDQVSAMLDRCLAYMDKASELIEEEYGKTLSKEAQSVRDALAKDDGWWVTVPDVPSLREDSAQPAA